MADNFRVAISYQKDLGYIEYDEAAKKAIVHLANDEGKARAEQYLAETHEIQVPHQTLMDFTAITVDPQEDVESLKLALTRLWNFTHVQVDWSRPVDYVIAHPHY